MKSLIALFLFLTSATSFAVTCFEAKSLPADLEGLPTVTCVSDVSLKLVIPTLPQTPYYQFSVKTNEGELVENKVIFREVGNKFKVAVKKVVAHTRGSGCDYSDSKVLSYSVLVDGARNIVPDSLEVEGIYTENYDECHSDDMVTIQKYSKL